MMSANAFPFSYSALSFALVKEGGERGQTLRTISTTIQIKAALFSARSLHNSSPLHGNHHKGRKFRAERKSFREERI